MPALELQPAHVHQARILTAPIGPNVEGLAASFFGAAFSMRSFYQ